MWWSLGVVLRDDVVESRTRELGTAKEVIVTTCLVLSSWLHEQAMLVSSWEGKGKTPHGCLVPRRWKPLLGKTEVCVPGVLVDQLSAICIYCQSTDTGPG